MTHNTSDGVDKCSGQLQHFWLPVDAGKIQCFSCPLCGQLVYWSRILLEWVKPATSNNKPIPGNKPTSQRGDE